MNAALYIRLSKEDDHDGPSESVSNQQALLTRYADENGHTIHDLYIDDGWSGGNFDRPAFRRMLSDIERGAVNMVVTKDLSRLGRDYILTGHYLERYFPEHRVRYVSLLDGIDTGIDTYANDITPFRAIMNDMYAKDISKKITSVKRDQQRRGLFIGGKPAYGYRKHPTDKNKLVIDETAAVIVRRIFSMALSGTSCRKIASTLNREQIPPPALYAVLPIAASNSYSGLWSSERISEMLQNEIYIGNMVQGKRIKSSYKSKKCHRQLRDDWVIVENTHEPLVTKEDFETVQRLLASRRKTRNRTYDHPLKGLIFCYECGHPLGIINRKNAKGEDVLYFICRTYQRFCEENRCLPHCIKAKNILELAEKAISTLCTPHLERLDLSSLAQQIILHTTDSQKKTDEPARVQARLQLLAGQIDKVYLDHLEGLIGPEDCTRILHRLQKERAALQKTLNDISRSPSTGIVPSITTEHLTAEFSECICSNRSILTNLVERISLTKENEIMIHFNFAEPPAFPLEE